MSDRVIVQRSQFGGPWRHHRLGEFVPTPGEGEGREWQDGLAWEHAEELVAYLNRLPIWESQAKYRVVPLGTPEGEACETTSTS